MKKTHFTRKNLIALALAYFYILISIFSALCIDTEAGIIKKGNPVFGLSNALGFPSFGAGIAQRWLLFVCLAVYILLFATAFIYEFRLAIYYEEKPFSKKWLSVYGITFGICTVLGFGLGLVSQYPYDGEIIKNSFLFSLSAFSTGLIIFFAFLSLIGAALILYVNFKNINKPFRFFDNRSELEKEEDRKNEAYEEAKEQGKLSEAFGEENKKPQVLGGGNTGTSLGSVPTLGGENLGLAKESVFPGLCELDNINEIDDAINFDDNLPLNELATKFRNYLAVKENLYFDIKTLRAFLAGLATTRLIILEGLSGTGKSSIARYFSDFIGETSFFAPVQTTWRDRTSILGFFNDFSKTYTETEFLKRLYEYTYKERQFNIMVLDEMNISRIEYYFADFLSVLEYPVDEWKIKIMQLPFGFTAPNHLEDGVLRIPSNTFFIGTANKDDSTYTITDKVYDRAITINFDNLNEPFEVKEEVEQLHLSYDFISSLFNEAKANEEFNLDKEDLKKFKVLTDFTYETFDLTFGNRIYNQILTFTPVFVGLGGTKEEALDFMFSRKIISKLEGRYEDYVKKGLESLLEVIKKTYGNSFKETTHVINKLLRKF